MSSVRYILLILTMIVIAGCSSGKPDPSAPAIPDQQQNIPSIDISYDTSNHNLLGTWTVTFDIESLTASVVPNRALNTHYNVTTMIPAPTIQVNSWDPVEEVVDVDVTLHNPSEINAYDVRLIIFTDDAAHKLLNDDNWTSLWDIPEGQIANPFKAYAKSEPNRVFSGQSLHHENFRIKCPNSNFDVQFAVDASYPGNCEEPYKITDFSQERFFDIVGSSTNIEVTVQDWQNNVNLVQLYCPEITGTALIDFSQINPETWQAELINNTGASMGDYQGYLIASSINSGNLNLIDDVKITVSDQNQRGWARTWGGVERDLCYDIAIDDNGSVYVTGIFKSEVVDFDPSPGVNEYYTNGIDDIFLSKFDDAGNYLWTRTWGGTSQDHGYSVTVENTDYLYVSGNFKGMVDFDPGPGEDLHKSGWSDSLEECVPAVFLSKFDQHGEFIWARTWGGEHRSGAFVNRAIGVGLDPFGGVFVGGDFIGITDFDPGPDEDIHNSVGDRDVFVSKFDTSGEYLWARTIGGVSGEDISHRLDCDIFGNVMLVGAFADVIDFDPGIGEDLHGSVGYTDIFVTRLDSDGNHKWARSWGGTDKDIGYGGYHDAAGNVYVTGYFQSSVDFNPSISGEDFRMSNGGADAFLSIFSPTGDYLNAMTWGGADGDRGYGVFISESQDIFVTGSFKSDSVDFDPGPGTYTKLSNGQADLYVSRFASSNDHIWTTAIGGTGDDASFRVVVDSLGFSYAAGMFDANVDFDPGWGKDWHETNGAHDAFALRLAPDGLW